MKARIFIAAIGAAIVCLCVHNLTGYRPMWELILAMGLLCVMAITMEVRQYKKRSNSFPIRNTIRKAA